MVSVDRFASSENDFFLNHHNGIGRSFPSRLDPHFSSLFDDNDVILQNLKDMKIGSSLLDSVFPFYNDIRHGRYNSYDLSRPLSHGGTTDVSGVPQVSGNVRVIPIKVELRPEKFQDENNTTFRLLNGPPKHKATAGEDPVLCPGRSFREFDDISSLDPPAWMTSKSPKSHNKYLSSVKPFSDAELKSPKSNDFSAKAYSAVIDKPFYDSKLNSPVSVIRHDCYGDKVDNWTTIPVKHIESSHTSVSDEELNSNNNSSRRRYSSTPRSRTSSKVKYDRENSNDSNIQSHSNRSRKTNPPHSACAASEQYHSANEESNKKVIPSTIEGDFDLPEIEHDEIVSPPHCHVYNDLKVKLTQEDRKIDYIEGDGNCLFRALSKGLYGSEKYHKAMRMFIVNLIGTNKSKFAQFVDDEDVEEHINRMCKDGCWATTCEIYAAATLFQRDIFMLTPDHMNEKYSWLLFQPVFKINEALSVTNTHPCYITLCNTNGNHYDRIVPDHGGCNCFLPHPELDGLATDSTSSTDTSSAAYVPVKR